MIIHIAGASGSGKTTLGKKLEEYYGNKVIVIDMDDLMDIFIKKHIQEIDTTEQFAVNYQQFIDDYREKLSKKYDNIIFVGLNAFVIGESHYYEDKMGIEKSIKLPKKYFDLKSDYNFYIDLPTETIIKQTFYRGYDRHIDWFCKWMKDRKDVVFSELIKNEDKAQKDISIAINRLFDFADIRKNITTWNKFYKDKGYEFLSREEIYDKIIKIIDGSAQQTEGQKGGDYYKYLKYKSKYLELSNKLIGGNKKGLVIHICGPSGSGKTTLGNKLKDTFGNKIVVKDIDDLRSEFVLEFYGGYDKFWKNKYKWNKEEYQKYIDKFVNKQTTSLVFVGLNHMPWWNKNLYYDMHPDYKFYIKMDSDTIFKQKCGRFIDDLFVKERDIVLKDIIKDEKGTIKRINNALKGECGYSETIEMNDMWNKDYKTQGYKFMSRENIFKEVSKILKTNM